MSREDDLQNLPKPDHRLPYIDTLRGFAAGWVFLLHVHGYWLENVQASGINASRFVTFFIGIGGLGVDLFIVLSGFCLFYPLMRFSKGFSLQFDACKFYRRRAFRLLPAYYTALFITTLLVLSPALQPYLVEKPLVLTNIFYYIFLVQTFSNDIISSINGSLWTIALESQLYLVFPILIIIYKRWGFGAVFAAGMTASVTWPFLSHWLIQNQGLNFSPEFHLPARWIEFIAGMLAAKMICHPIREIKAWSVACFALTLPLTIVFQTSLFSDLLIREIVKYAVIGTTFASLIVLLAGFRQEVFIRKTRLGTLTQFGVVSYSFYLLHQPILLLFKPLFRIEGMNTMWVFGLSMITAFPVTLLLAYLFFVYIENPFIAHGKRTKNQVFIESIADRSVP